MFDAINPWKTGISLTTGFFLVIFGIAALVIIPNIGNISEKLGFDTKESLKAKTEQQKAQIDHANEVNGQMSETIKNQSESNKETLLVLDKNLSKEAADKDKSNQIDQQRKDKIQQASNQVKSTVVNKTSSTVKSEQTKEKTISQIQITSVWQNYCNFNDDDQCQGQLQGAGV